MTMTGDAIRQSPSWQAMRNWILWRLCLGLVPVALLLASCSSQQVSGQETNTAAGLTPEATVVGDQAPADADPLMEDPTTQSDLADAAVTPISTSKPLPANLKLSGPVAEVIKLAESSAEESVILAFVTNSMAPFNLGVEEIIYVNDVGVPASVVTAMIQRDQVLKELSASAAPAPVPSAPSDPGLYAPQPAEASAPPEIAPEAAPPPTEVADYPVFYDSLAPYGTWVNVAGYGPCWQPTVVIANPGWRPYCDGGRWLYSDCGWYWLSGYSWGWAPFHYGRWFQHHRMGWCWAPDTVWGPSWVAWRYNRTHCGWAPLPPRTSFSAGGGLAYRGHPVGSACGFGLGARSFTFVEASHFRDRHLNRHALPPQHTDRIFKDAPPSTSIIRSGNRVTNHGIPPSRIAQATRTEIHQVAIRPVSYAAGQGVRGERFEGNGRTLSAFRPQFPSSTGTRPRSSGRPGSEARGGGGAPATTSTAQHGVPAQRPKTGGSAMIAQPNASISSLGTPPRPAALAPTPATTRPAPAAPPPRSSGRDTATKTAQPLILHGPDRPNPGATSGSVSTHSGSAPRPTPTPPSRREANPQPTVSQSSARTVEASRSQSTSLQRDAFQRQQPVTASALSTPARSDGSRPTSRAAAAPVRSEPQRSFPVPSSPAPAQAPRSAPTPAFAAPRSTPAPAFTPARSMPTPSFTPARSTPTPSFTPPPTRSFSPPAVSSAPRAPAVASRPASPAPSAPAASAPRSSGGSSSASRGR